MRIAAIFLAASLLAPAPFIFAEEEAPATEPADAPKKVQPIDFRKLKELLPGEVGGVEQSDSSGSRQKIGDMAISQATGEYNAEAGDDDEAQPKSAQVIIIDYGGSPEMIQGMTAWTQMEIDNESDDGYQRTVEVQGFKGLEQYNFEGKQGSLVLAVANRFLVTIHTNQHESDVLKATGEAMKLKDLAALAE
jgi:hypothetical protein